MVEHPEKKLRRGLEDLSPLFQRTPAQGGATLAAAPVAEISFEVQFLTVCAPEGEGDSFLANAGVASRMVQSAPLISSLVSIAPGFNANPSASGGGFLSFELLDPRISKLTLSHQELWGLAPNGTNGSLPAPLSLPCLVFLSFEPDQFHSLSRIALLLDRVILLVQPRVESLREAYRLMKMFSSYSREIEFFLLFRRAGSGRDIEEFLFERFSLITSRFLGISPGWMGELPFPGRGRRVVPPPEDGFGFHAEPLLGAPGLRRPLSPEKMRLWKKLRKTLPIQSPNESSTPSS
jgi:hypothetical protein